MMDLVPLMPTHNDVKAWTARQPLSRQFLFRRIGAE